MFKVGDKVIAISLENSAHNDEMFKGFVQKYIMTVVNTDFYGNCVACYHENFTDHWIYHPDSLKLYNETVLLKFKLKVHNSYKRINNV